MNSTFQRAEMCKTVLPQYVLASPGCAYNPEARDWHVHLLWCSLDLQQPLEMCSVKPATASQAAESEKLPELFANNPIKP